MTKNCFYRAQLAIFSLVSSLGLVTLLTGCSSPCSNNPTEMGCDRLTITSISRIERVPTGSESVEIHLENMTNKSSPRVTLQAQDGGHQVFLAVTDIGDDGKMVAQIDQPRWLPVGPALLTVEVGSQWAQQLTAITDPIPSPILPTWGNPIIYSYPTDTTALDISTIRLPDSSADLPVVHEKQLISNMPYTQLQGYQLVFDSFHRTSYLQPETTLHLDTKTSLSTVQPSPPLFGINHSFVINIYHCINNMTNAWKISQLFLSNLQVTNYDDNILKPASLFAIDSEEDLLLLAQGTNLQALYLTSLAPQINQLTVDIPATQWQFLGGSHAYFGNHLIRFFALDGKNQWQFLSLKSNMVTLTDRVTVDQSFTDAVNAKLTSLTIKTLILKDINLDGQADVVMVLQNPDGTVDTIGWLPYQVGVDGTDQFGELQRVPLPTPLIDILPTIAVGDFNGDGKPDIALASPKTLYVYLNQAI